MNENLRKQHTVTIIRDFITKRVTIERRDFGALVDKITFTQDEFFDLKELIKDVERW
jgi:hypothetical protein